MKLPGLPEEKIESEPEGSPQAPPSGPLVHHTVVEHHPGDLFKKIFSVFKTKPAATSPMSNGVHTTPRRSSGQGIPRRPGLGLRPKNPEPDLRLRAFTAPEMDDLPVKKSPKLNLRPTREKTRRAFWDVAAVLSLVVNAILVGVLLVMGGQIKNLKTTMNDLLGGLYGNFVEMDNASITTTIPVEAQIPIVFNLPIQQNTTVTLTSAVPIAGARVVINSGGLSINAPANVTLPEGTSLPIALNMDIPVQLTVPISLQVPVNIPMAQTTLHGPFTGLQDTVRPLYCTLNKNAQYPQGVYICAEHDLAPTGTP